MRYAKIKELHQWSLGNAKEKIAFERELEIINRTLKDKLKYCKIQKKNTKKQKKLKIQRAKEIKKLQEVAEMNKMKESELMLRLLSYKLIEKIA